MSDSWALCCQHCLHTPAGNRSKGSRSLTILALDDRAREDLEHAWATSRGNLHGDFTSQLNQIRKGNITADNSVHKDRIWAVGVFSVSDWSILLAQLPGSLRTDGQVTLVVLHVARGRVINLPPDAYTLAETRLNNPEFSNSRVR